MALCIINSAMQQCFSLVKNVDLKESGCDAIQGLRLGLSIDWLWKVLWGKTNVLVCVKGTHNVFVENLNINRNFIDMETTQGIFKLQICSFNVSLRLSHVSQFARQMISYFLCSSQTWQCHIFCLWISLFNLTCHMVC